MSDDNLSLAGGFFALSAQIAVAERARSWGSEGYQISPVVLKKKRNEKGHARSTSKMSGTKSPRVIFFSAGIQN